MLVTVFCAPRDRPESTFALDVSPELELRDFVALCELESGIPAGEIQITYVEQPLKDPTRALGNYGVKDGDVVVLRQADRRPPPTQPAFPGLPQIDFRSITVPGTSSSSTSQQAAPKPPQAPPPSAAQHSTPVAFRGSGSSPQGLDDPALLQQMLLSNPHELSLLKERNPPLADALLSGDLERFTKVLLEQQQDRARREQERIRLLTADPFDLDAQAKIEEDIRQHNVEENMTIAMEEAPESFGQVVMLYINCKVNGHPVKAFVDSGAQMTIMSQACAERCNIMRLVDRRWAGIAKGVGTQKIIGRVHLAQVQIEGDFLPCSFSILEDQPMDMLLGLDMLKRHQCSIDLKRSVLLIGTTGTETRFLAEAELPECARLAYGAEGREDARPEEMADRELAEALQRSIQESDTADGQTTSPQSTPFPLPRPSHQMSSSTSPSQSPSAGPAHIPALDRSQSAPAAMVRASVPEQCRERAGCRDDVPQPSPLGGGCSLSSPFQLNPNPTCDNRDSPPDSLPIHASPPVVTLTNSPALGGLAAEALTPDRPVPDAAQTDSAMHVHADEPSPVQLMEQEASGPHAADATETCRSDSSPPDSGDMESITALEQEQAEGERSSSSDSIPSVAAALLELHELLVSNNRAQSQNCSTSCSPSNPFRQDADGGDEKEDETPSTAITVGAEPTNAKANHATVTDERPSTCLVPDLCNPDEHLDGEEEELGPPQHHCGSSEGCGEADDIGMSPAESAASPHPAGGPESKEAPGGQQGRGAADGPASGTSTPDAVGPQSEHTDGEKVSSAASNSIPAPDPPLPHPLPPPPAQHPFMEQFPAEHIQRIQAAGFSAREAAEALEQAHGIVELALLALLARSIIVPT